MCSASVDDFQFLYEAVTQPPALRGDTVLVTTRPDGITTVELNTPPVNLFTPDYLGYVNDWLRWLYHDPQTRAIIFTSHVPNQFCAGGDLNECVNPTLAKTRRFWGEVQNAWLVLNAHRKPVVSVITGTCPGGGCVLSMACEYRVMVRRSSQATTASSVSSSVSARGRAFRIGLNAPAFGICMPFVVSQVYRELLGLRRAETMLQRGTMLTADDAVHAGLVDIAVDSKEDGLLAAEQFLEDVLKTPSETRYRQKMQLRLPFIAPLATQEGRDEEIREFFRAVNNEPTQAMLTSYLATLHERKHRSPPHL